MSPAHAAASRLGTLCLTFNLGGHGDSDGVREQLSLRDHLNDARCAYDALAESAEVDSDRIGLCGASYGAYLAALLIGERPASRVFLRAPSLHPDDWLDTPARDHRRPDEPPPRSVAVKNLAAFGGQALVLEGGRDDEIRAL